MYNLYSPNKRSFRGTGGIVRGLDSVSVGRPKSAHGNWPLWPPAWPPDYFSLGGRRKSCARITLPVWPSAWPPACPPAWPPPWPIAWSPAWPPARPPAWPPAWPPAALQLCCAIIAFVATLICCRNSLSVHALFA
jgi:hypothetical protein